MIIVPHVLVGSTIGARSKKIWSAFIFGFLSHFLLDALPHWDYVDSLRDLIIPINFIKLVIDFILAFSIVLLIIWFFSYRFKKGLIFIGAFSAILPDFLDAIYIFFNIKLLRPLSLVHDWIHCGLKLSFWQNLPILLILCLLSIFLLIKSCCII